MIHFGRPSKPSARGSTRGSHAWFWTRLQRPALAAVLTLLALAILAIGAPWIAPRDPNSTDLRGALEAPGAGGHTLGSDELGRDILSRVIYGSRASLATGLVVVGIAGTLGVALGAIGGYWGGIVDALIMRCADVLMAFPFLVLAIAAVAITGPGLFQMMVVLGAVTWTGYARLTRSLVLIMRRMAYVQAALAVGAGEGRILWRHILPNCLGVLIVQATFGVATSMLAASGLSYLGMGAQPPMAEWGAMLSTAQPYLRQRPLMSIAPGVAIMLSTVIVNFAGDAFRDVLDPRSRA